MRRAYMSNKIFNIKWLSAVTLSLWCITLSANTINLDKGSWIDLTHAFDKHTIYWPTADNFKKTTVFEGQTDGGFYYSAYNFEAAEHGGTHMDSPIHFYKNKRSVEQVPIEQLIGPAVVIDISKKAENNRNYQLQIADIKAFEKKYGVIPQGSILLINTGSAAFYHDKEKYMGTTKRGAQGVKALSFPGIHPDTATFIVKNRKIKAIGLDTPSLDYGKSTHFESHVILFKHNIPGFENVTNLDRLPATGAVVIALPMKIRGGSGAPLRIVAFVAK